ncbi:hypothetical protein [Limosilactobacillus reuteri]|uniref:hypothetical protein n=1 Tax=Limosilactobacillus reuteri TaxID=1598 RepID=UPI001749F0EC|nr:hypothetical protein [Limosilactobacillus reuteri]UFK66946.1 hypothetical protein IU404_02413 [Limosilactobacillus reuteri]UFK67007.1 hypothetical protein IU404_02476 [Limosilactobacillus reuteri]UFK69028.1 hypothetical protein IVR12_02138 [Limosilactobacillus reuteri]
MTILYRMKNPHTNKYFCKSADLINEAPLEYSLVYTEETAQKIIHDANVMGKLLFDHLGYKEDFKGYILEEASLDSIQIPEEWKPYVKRISRIDHISISEAQKVFRQELVDYWDKWAMYDPFTGKEMPTKRAPFE